MQADQQHKEERSDRFEIKSVTIMADIPDWIAEWIKKDRLVHNKFRISKNYLRHSKRIQLVSEEKGQDGEIVTFHYIVHSPKYGRYNVRYERGTYHCNCPFFKHRLICSHILGVCQLTGVWLEKDSLFPNHEQNGE
ncbi:MAG: hypothetical protein EAX95_05435 [Candidatus Thorarchaeota archaeon]|nr:hypothetical protein [Candidatus Thorarchaeota archaeon]